MTSFLLCYVFDAFLFGLIYANAAFCHIEIVTGAKPRFRGDDEGTWHGWANDIYSYVDVAPLLASAGYRVIVPFLRGYGTTRFFSSETARNGQQAVIAVDIIALMDPLKIEKACKHAHRLIGSGIGHNLPQEVPQAFAEAVVEVDGYRSA